jgi:soluble lytic murein transglycosylase
MQNDVLGYYPEYWKLTVIWLSTCESIVSFAQRYPQSAMAEKLAADYVEEKVKQADFASAQPVLPMCPILIKQKVVLWHKSVPKVAILWFLLNIKMFGYDQSQPESCNGLGA